MVEDRIWSLCEVTPSHAQGVKGLAAFLGMDSAECPAEAKAWLSEGVPADIQLQPTQRHWEKG